MEVVEHFNNVQQTAWESAPDNKDTSSFVSDCPPTIREKIAKKHKISKQWQQNRCPENKKCYNRAVRELKTLLQNARNHGLQTYILNKLECLCSNRLLSVESHKKLKHLPTTSPSIRKSDNSWARSNAEKAEVFIKHLSSVLTPNPNVCLPDDKINIDELLNQTN